MGLVSPMNRILRWVPQQFLTFFVVSERLGSLSKQFLLERDVSTVLNLITKNSEVTVFGLSKDDDGHKSVCVNIWREIMASYRDVHIYICIYTHVYVHLTYTYTPAYTCTCTCTCTYLCICRYIYIYVYMHIYTHTYIYIHLYTPGLVEQYSPKP